MTTCVPRGTPLAAGSESNVTAVTMSQHSPPTHPMMPQGGDAPELSACVPRTRGA